METAGQWSGFTCGENTGSPKTFRSWGTRVLDINLSLDPALPHLERCSAATERRFLLWVSEEFLYEEAYAWRLRHPVLVDTLLKEGKVNELERHVMDYLTGVARAEKAKTCGYHPDDESFYTPGVIAQLLPMTLDVAGAVLTAAPPDRDEGGRTNNPHKQSDFISMLADVARAWATTPLNRTESRVIEMRFLDDMDYDHIAASLQMEKEDVEKAAARGLRRLCDRLGGLPTKKGCPSECIDCEERNNG